MWAYSYFDKNSKMLYGFGKFTFKQYFHGYIYPRIVDNPNNFARFSGIPRNIARGGFTSGETDLSGITLFSVTSALAPTIEFFPILALSPYFISYFFDNFNKVVAQ